MAIAVYELLVSGLHYGQHVENSMKFIGDPADGTQTLTEGADLIQAWFDAIANPFLEALPPTYQLLRLSARCLKPSVNSNVAHQQVVNSGMIGTFGTEAQSDNLCPAITLIPPMGIKSPGRVYMPCIAKTAITNNQYTNAYAIAIAAAFDPMIAGFSNSTITWNLAVYSKKNDVGATAINYNLSTAIGFQGKRRRPL